jgi:DNA ligase-1
MQRFAELYEELDRTTRTSEKRDALERYFRNVPPEDAIWAIYLLGERKRTRGVSRTRLREWAAGVAGLPQWLVDECREEVGDTSELIALLVPDPAEPTNPPLHRVMRERVSPLAAATDADQREIVSRAWSELGPRERYLYQKLMSGAFRVGVARNLVVQALARVAAVEPGVMAHRMMGEWRPTAEHYQRLIAPTDESDDLSRPYPFCLAEPLLKETREQIAEIGDWQIEWKWDGMRAQVIRRGRVSIIWSRGEELLTRGFWEIRMLADRLPDGTVLDGEILAWEGGRPLPFAELQKRMLRKVDQPRLFSEIPVVFMAYDLLESDGIDLRSKALRERRERLEAVADRYSDSDVLELSPVLSAQSWEELAQLRELARNRGVEGLMLKRFDSTYEVGRHRGAWWKWKAAPYEVDAVLIGAQLGTGKRAGLFTDYTFAVWKGDALVPVAKAYSGLSNAEIKEVDEFVREHTVGRHGPVRMVEPALVFQLGFEGIARSPRHKSGIAMRFPRILRWRRDKRPDQADQLEALERMLASMQLAAGGR